MTLKQINLKNKKYLLYNDLINIEKFDSNLLRLDKKESIGVDIYYVEYLAQKPDYLEGLQPLYLLIKESFGFTEECDGNKYLNIAVTKNNEDVY